VRATPWRRRALRKNTGWRALWRNRGTATRLKRRHAEEIDQHHVGQCEKIAAF
jgi:hypothetical protein